MIKKFSVESILVMLLFIVFAGSIGMLIIAGKSSYEAIIENKNANEELRIAYAYMDKKIKQNDRSHAITLLSNPFNEYGALRISHSGSETGYFTTIFYYENEVYESGLYEIMTLENEPILIELSEKIISLEKPMSISFDKMHQLIYMTYDVDEKMIVHINSKVVIKDEK